MDQVPLRDIPLLLGKKPRNNFPRRLARKRTESTIVLSFARTFLKSMGNRAVLAAREVALNGYGIADLVCLVIAENRYSKPNEKAHLLAFEVKIRDWRKALAQAFRYKYFAHASTVVLPPEDSQKAMQFLDTFKALAIGLWSFDIRSGEIRRLYTPDYQCPFSDSAHAKATKLFSHRLRSQPPYEKSQFRPE
jgi:hypothetical protein